MSHEFYDDYNSTEHFGVIADFKDTNKTLSIVLNTNGEIQTVFLDHEYEFGDFVGFKNVDEAITFFEKTLNNLKKFKERYSK